MKNLTNKTEILAPAGSFEMLEYAIAGGADAIYIGGKNFSARAFSPNFSLEEIKKAVEKCHLFGVKLYVAFNTLVKEKELEEAKEYLAYLNSINVDAVIMTDLGLIYYSLKTFPELPIHASTQLSITTIEEANFLQTLGVKRIVLARELTEEEVFNIVSNVSMEFEIFVHGAICVSMSGKCLLSSYFGNRSANRGMCAQPCRLNSGKIYPLSLKDLSLINQINKLTKNKFISLKIEGRMKQKEYAFFASSAYKKAIKGLEYQKEFDNLSLVFNRGYTEGYFKSVPERTINYANHQGVLVGSVCKVTYNSFVIKLTTKVLKNDILRIKSFKDVIIKVSKDEDSFLIVNKQEKLKVGDRCFLTKRMFDKKKFSIPKIPISISFYQDDSYSYLELRKDNFVVVNKILHTKEKVLSSSQEEIIKERLLKLNDTVFKAGEISVKLDYFIQGSFLTILKRDTLKMLCEEMISFEIKKTRSFSYPKLKEFHSSLMINRTENKYTFEPRAFTNGNFDFKEMINVNETTIFSSPYLGVYNHLTLVFLLSLGVKAVFLGIELSYQELKEIIDKFKSIYNFLPNTGIYLSGNLTLMVFRNTELKTFKLNNECFYIEKHDGLNYLKSYKSLNNETEKSKLISLGITNFYREKENNDGKTFNYLKIGVK